MEISGIRSTYQAGKRTAIYFISALLCSAFAGGGRKYSSANSSYTSSLELGNYQHYEHEVIYGGVSTTRHTAAPSWSEVAQVQYELQRYDT